MSFRPRFPVTNNSFPPPNNNFNRPAYHNFSQFSHRNVFRPNTHNPTLGNIPPNAHPQLNTNPHSFPHRVPDLNKSSLPHNAFPAPQSFNSSPVSCASGIPNNLPNTHFSNTYVPRNKFISHQPVVNNPIRNPVDFSNNTFSNNAQANNLNSQYPVQNTPFNNLPPPNIGYQSNPPVNVSSSSFLNPVPTLPPVCVPSNASRLHFPTVNNSIQGTNRITSSPNFLTMPPPVTMHSSIPPSNYGVQMPPPMFKNDALQSNLCNNTSYQCDEETKLTNFLTKFFISKKRKDNQVAIPEFRCALKAAIHMIKLLAEKKNKLSTIVDASETEWKSEMQSIRNLKNELSTICSIINDPVYLNCVMKKLQLVKRRRERKKKTKQNKLSEKIKAAQKREEINQKIDKWLEDIKEKNLKLKREVEMKKEADFILLEVRRKIHEGKKTIEKIKVFEKLRNARQANAVQKGLHILTEQNEKFEKKMSLLKETMQKQLVDYEAEEKALKVMLETEHEGQLEEEAQWKIKKAKALQQKRQRNITECLFGISEDPMPTDPLYLFHKYHSSANASIENLIQIRHQWDVHLSEDGDAIPRQWVVPIAASNAAWEKCLASAKT